MARTTSSNYTTPSFPIASVDADAFDANDVQQLAAAVNGHDHTTGKGIVITSGGGGAGGDKLLLNHVTTADIVNSGAVNAATWTNLGPSLNFTVDDTAAVIEISTSIGAWIGPNSAGAVVAGSRVLIDGTTGYKLGGIVPTTSAYGNPFSGAGTVAITGLSAATHTAQLQVYATIASQVSCLPTSHPGSGFAVRIWQRHMAP